MRNHVRTEPNKRLSAILKYHLVLMTTLLMGNRKAHPVHRMGLNFMYAIAFADLATSLLYRAAVIGNRWFIPLGPAEHPLGNVMDDGSL